jgi:hypothetical protein
MRNAADMGFCVLSTQFLLVFMGNLSEWCGREHYSVARTMEVLRLWAVNEERTEDFEKNVSEKEN